MNKSVEKLFVQLINANSLENESNTPDWILAEFLAGCLRYFDTAVQQREAWYGRATSSLAAAPKPEVTIIARPEHAQAINETAAQQVARPIEAESGSINPAGAAATLLNRGKK